jgi:16S rRNA processing protein RimM
MPELLLVGRIARAHGNRGQVIVNPETDFAEERYRSGAVIWVGHETSAQPREILSVRFQQGRPIVGLSGVESITDAEALAGAELWMPRDVLGELPPGTYYRHDLVGCDVVDVRDANGIGRVARVDGTLEYSCLIVETPAGDEVLIPLVADICTQIDVAARRIVVNSPEGLLDLNRRADGPGHED